MMRGGRTGGSGRCVKWVCTDFLRDTYCVFRICATASGDREHIRAMIGHLLSIPTNENERNISNY